MGIKRFFKRVFKKIGTFVRCVFPCFGSSEQRRRNSDDDTQPLVLSVVHSDDPSSTTPCQSTRTDENNNVSHRDRFSDWTLNCTPIGADPSGMVPDGPPHRPSSSEIGELKDQFEDQVHRIKKLETKVAELIQGRSAPTIGSSRRAPTSVSSPDSSSLPPYTGEHADVADPNAEYGVMTGTSTSTHQTKKKTQ